MKPQAGMGNQMNPELAQLNQRNQQYQQQLQQNPAMGNPNDPASQGIMGGMGQNIQQLLQQRMGGMQRPGMPLPPSAEQRPNYGPGLPPGGMPPAYGAGGRFGMPQGPVQSPGMNTGVVGPPVQQPGFTPPAVPRGIPEMPNIQSMLQQAKQRQQTIQAGLPATSGTGGMNPYAQKLKQTGANPAVQPTVTSKMRPTMKSDMSGKPPALKFSNPIQQGRKVAAGPQQSRGAWLQNATKKFGKPQV